MDEIAARCEFRVGDRIGEKYVVEKTIGEGSFGIVYKVADNTDGQTKALKLFKFWELNPEMREEMASRSQMEFDTGRIESNYLVHTLETGTVRGNPYIIMEYCPYGDLPNFIRSRQDVDLIKIAKEILMGLNDLHRNGKVHRDLKPENVLIKPEETAALTDFGIAGDRAKRLTSVDFFGRPKDLMGTVIYMAPEQAKPRNREVTVLPTMDIFAFGVMMYLLITGNYPFGPLDNQNDLVEYIKHAREGHWNKWLLTGNPTGKKFEKVISGCLKADYKQRLQTVDAIWALMPHGAGLISKNMDQTGMSSITHGLLLRVMQGEDHGAVYKLNDLQSNKNKIITVGFNAPGIKNVLPVTEKFSRYVSRKQCTLERYTDNQWYIRDGQWDKSATGSWKRSLNGTYVNSAEVSQDGITIHPGDIITIGDIKLRV
ncbi:MAG: protein kinase, partial [Tannerella sp.]|nr:protein kinase [Tannerella sp.]